MWDPDKRPGNHDQKVFPYSKHEGYNRNPANVGGSFIKYTTRTASKNGLGMTTSLAFTVILGSNPTQSRFWKKVIKIGEECAWFQTASWRRAEQVRMTIEKDWISLLEIVEIRQKTNSESTQDTDTITDRPNIHKQEHSNRNEPQHTTQTTQSKH